VSKGIINKVLESPNNMHENTGDGHNFLSANGKLKPIPEPQYLSCIVASVDDQMAMFHINFTQIYFPGLKLFFAFVFSSNCHDGVMRTPPQQASS
jgi:hypothetical protein